MRDSRLMKIRQRGRGSRLDAACAAAAACAACAAYADAADPYAYAGKFQAEEFKRRFANPFHK